MADPTREQLRQLHGAFGEFWDASPWQALDDLDVVAVEHPSGLYTGYCSVLGSAFREYGLAVFIGDEGLAGYLDMVNDEVDPESPEGFDRMNALLAVRVPPHFVTLKVLPAEVACLDVARYGKNRFLLVRREEIADEAIYSVVYLGRSGAGRKRKVHAVNEAGVVHAGEPPKRRFRLA